MVLLLTLSTYFYITKNTMLEEKKKCLPTWYVQCGNVGLEDKSRQTFLPRFILTLVQICIPYPNYTTVRVKRSVSLIQL